MCDFGAWGEWRNRIRGVSSYLDVDTRKDQYHLLNTIHLEIITGYMIKDDIGDKYFKKLSQ